MPSSSVLSEVTLLINGKKYTVDARVAASTSLNVFLRNHANAKGTKNMCQEGGCGACVVSVTARDPVSGQDATFAVNSCLTPVFSCHGWSVTTVEGLGSKASGYHPIQKRLSSHHGTQCGYCSPGMVMNMYALTKDKNVTMSEVENSFGGNICRCTGYRPILDAFKSLASDAPPTTDNADIEDLASAKGAKVCPKSGRPCLGTCARVDDAIASAPVHLALAGADWLKVNTVKEIFAALDKAGSVPYMLVAGNTAQGVYRRETQPAFLVDISGVSELRQIATEPRLVIGGNASLTAAMTALYDVAKAPGYAYAKALADHIDLIANVPVRNQGTIAGNLMMKRQVAAFPSDVYLMLETVGASVVVMDASGAKTEMSLPDFLAFDMHKKIILQVALPKLDEQTVVRTFKIMPRAQNAHAYVNAGFLVRMDKGGVVLSKPRLLFGGIAPDFLHADRTEALLTGKSLFDPSAVNAAMRMLDEELRPDHVLPDASAEYRKGLAQALMYKFVLSVQPKTLARTLASGAETLTRPLSSGRQEYDARKELFPLNEPVPKVESLYQCSGEAQYVDDIPLQPNELHAAFVLTRVAQGTIKKIDASEALKVPGVVAFLDHTDIPGSNDFLLANPLFGIMDSEEVFCSGRIRCAGQTVGLVVATTRQVALDAVKLVRVELENVTQGVYSLRQVLASGDQSKVMTMRSIEPRNKELRGEAVHELQGSFNVGGQYHYTMEPQSCVVVPVEDGLDVYPAAQYMDLVQTAIANALLLPLNAVNVKVRRLGGGYGGKITRASLVAVACAIAAHRLRAPVRMVMSLEANMEAIGKRYDVNFDYKVGFDSTGHIKFLDSVIHHNSGWTHNETAGIAFITPMHLVSCYDDSTWTVTNNSVLTDTPSNTSCRAPGSVEAIAFIETVMEHIGSVLKKDPLEVRLANMADTEDGTMQKLVVEHTKTCDFQARKAAVDEFNKTNRWTKRGIAVVPMNYHFSYFGNYNALVSIYAGDGTVSVTTGGIEMGQGLNTKVAQVVAHTLGVPLASVLIKPSDNLTAPNNMCSGGSATSESCAYAAMKACEVLLERLQPIRASLPDGSWLDVIKAAHGKTVDLCATYLVTPRDDPKAYCIWGVTVTEVEVDILTGQHQILRVDLMEDAGESLSPEVDVGQMEGAFVMGLGYWLSESLVFHPVTGELLTNRTWNYKPPGAKDIPIDFRVQFRRNAPNPVGVLRSKATGEPPQAMAVSVFFAVRNALKSARADAGLTDDWFLMDAPATAENIFLTGQTRIEQFVI